MKLFVQHTAHPAHGSFLRVCLIVLFLGLLLPAYAQNTKGDQPAKPSREARFNTKQKKSKKDKASGKRISPKGKSQATSGAKGPGKGEAWTGDITGRKIPATRSSKISKSKNVHPQQAPRTYSSVGDDGQRRMGTKPPKRITPRSASSRARNVYPQKGPYVKKTYPPQSDDSQKFRAGTKTSQPKVRSATGSTRNVFPQRGPYVKKTTPPQRGDTQNFKAGTRTPQQKIRSATGSVRNTFTQRGPYVAKTRPPAKGDATMKWSSKTSSKKIRTATGSTRNVFPQKGPYVAKSRPPGQVDAQIRWGRKAISPNKVRSTSGPQWGKGGPTPRIRTATGTTRNVFPQRGPYVRGANLQPRQTEKPPGIKKKRTAPLSASQPFIRNKSINAYAGFWNTKKKPGDQAHVGDISGKTIRRRNYETQKTQGVIPSISPYLRFKGRKSGDTHYTGKAAGSHVSATRGPQAWQGDISGRKLRTRNYSSKDRAELVGKPLGKLPYTGDRRVGIFSGNIKARKPEKGGGSVSGQLWNKPLVGKTPGRGALEVGAYSGSIKARKKEPGKEVGGIVGNFKMSSVTGMTQQGAGYTGNIKARKPEKGGGSVSGQLWNNNEKPLAGRSPKGSTLAMGAYQGSLKARKKEAGAEADQFPGKHRMFDVYPSMRKQGADFTGHIKVRKLKNDYIQNSYAAKESLLKMRPGKQTFLVTGVHVQVKQHPYDKKKHAPNSALPGNTPGKTMIRASEYARGMKQYKYIQNPSSAKASLNVHDPGKAQGEMSSYSRGIRQNWKYVHNPSASDEALKIRDHRQAMARVTDYQGNIKMKKSDLFNKKGLHPDAQFVKTNKNNVKEERNTVTNLKLLWARWFKKSDTQPEHLKEKVKKPRYDKGEIGLWYR